MEAFVILILFGVIVIECMWAYNSFILPGQIEKAKKETADMLSYQNYDSILTLKKRDPAISKIVKIAKDHDVSIKHEPETLHVGAVSVGGVVSGGTYTTGGYNYVSDDGASGYYRLEYDGHMIKTIQLDHTLFLQAKDSPIAQYLNNKEETIVVVTKPVLNQWEQDIAFKMLQSGYMDPALKRGYPNQAKCMNILTWMTSTQ